MKSIILKSIRMLLIMTVITGIVYPLIITAIANSGFKEKAQGSLVYKDGRVIGSKLIGQKFDNPGYFWPRPSVTGYNTMPSGASNLGPTSKQLQKLVSERAAAFIAANGLKENCNIPVELLTASGSGLDPDVSPDAALMQVDRIAKARGMEPRQIRELVELLYKMSEYPQFHIFGEDRINILMLNLELDKIK